MPCAPPRRTGAPLHRALQESPRLLLAELAEAGACIQSILPPPIDDGPLHTDWCFQPSAQLGADRTGTLAEFTAALTELRNGDGFRVGQLLDWARAHAKDGILDDDYSLLRVSLGGVGGRDRT